MGSVYQFITRLQKFDEKHYLKTEARLACLTFFNTAHGIVWLLLPFKWYYI